LLPLWWLQSSLGCSSGLVAKPMTPLILKRASVSRSSGQWRDDDYDVLENGVVVGRISKEQARVAGSPLDVGERGQRRYQARRPWLRADARGGDGGICKILARGADRDGGAMNWRRGLWRL
jgi:hypothetical protein